MHIKLKRTPGLYLTGFMGAGKTTVGRLLAEKLGWDFADLDSIIEYPLDFPIKVMGPTHMDFAPTRASRLTCQLA